MRARTDFERRMLAEGRCTGCGVSLQDRRRQGAQPLPEECGECARARIPHGAHRFSALGGAGLVGDEFRRRLGYSTVESGAEQLDDGNDGDES